MLIQPWIRVMYCSTLVSITYQSRDQYLLSIHSWDSSTWQVLYPIVLFFCVCFCVVLVFFKCIRHLTSFLFKFKLFSLLIKQLFSHEMVKVSRLFYLFVCFLHWNGRVIINNFITFLLFPKDLQCSSFISILA